MTTADGVIETRADGQTVIHFERRLAHSPERVWEAITDPEQVIRWWGELSANLRQGGDFTLRWLNEDEEGRSSGWRGTLTEYDPPRVLETTGLWGSMSEAWGENNATLRFELTPDGDGTVLRFTNTLETMPDEFRTKTLAGWHWHLDALAGVLDGKPDRKLWDVEGWEPLHELYVEQYA
ncbi:MAG TPA: SRPBCC family protein [Thermoleophilaceae bacterium]|jgi:uncharacterized protein YndB with AHSA1/START domain